MTKTRLDADLDPDPIQDLSRDLARGDPMVWAALYETHAERIWKLVARLVGRDGQAVADVVQETFLAAARSVGRFDPRRGTPAHWLNGIARNQVALHWRRTLRRRERQGSALFDRVAADGAEAQTQWDDWLCGAGPGPPESLEQKEQNDMIRVALSRLDAGHADLLIAHYLEGESAAGLAADHRISESAVRSRLARARRAFREVFLYFDEGTSDER